MLINYRSCYHYYKLKNILKNIHLYYRPISDMFRCIINSDDGTHMVELSDIFYEYYINKSSKLKLKKKIFKPILLIICGDASSIVLKYICIC